MGLKHFLSELRLYLCNFWVNRLPSHRIRLTFYKHVMRFDISPRSAIHMDCTFDAKGGLEIGEGTTINGSCRLDTRGGIAIGKNVSISQGSMVLTADHDANSPIFEGRNRNVKIGDYVWVGTRVTILPGVKIGDGAVVGAGSVVTKDIEPFTIVAGVPARPIGRREITPNYEAHYPRLFQ